jgi:hypothetical protein
MKGFVISPIEFCSEFCMMLENKIICFFPKYIEEIVILTTVGQGSILRPNHSEGSVATQKLRRSIKEEEEEIVILF